MEYRHEFVYQGITVGMKPLSVHIYAGEQLAQLLREPGNPALRLARHILEAYERVFRSKLHIPEHSLAIEIIAHVFADHAAEAIQSLIEKIAPHSRGPVTRLMERISRSAEVIDCGEASCDSNRFLWDALVPVRGAFYALVKAKSSSR